MMLFETGGIEMLKQCQEKFGLEIPSILLAKRVNKFDTALGAQYAMVADVSPSSVRCPSHPEN